MNPGTFYAADGAIPQTDKAAEDAIRLLESHLDFALVQVRMRERIER
jgi:hypothetical protein